MLPNGAQMGKRPMRPHAFGLGRRVEGLGFQGLGVRGLGVRVDGLGFVLCRGWG